MTMWRPETGTTRRLASAPVNNSNLAIYGKMLLNIIYKLSIGPSCICCVDFNMSLIDLGGPGCVRLKYLGVEEGVALNVSYGDSLLHSNTVRSPDPEPTCLNIFSRLAQMCAKFTKLVRNDGGLQGCVHLEPMLLEEVQLELPIGCFDMNADGMKEIVPPVKEAQGQDKEVPQVASANQEYDITRNLFY